MTPDNLQKIMRCTPDKIALWYGPLMDAMKEFGILTPFHRAAFIANIGHETGGLNRFEENLNYNAQRLTVVWPSRFPSLQSAQFYANNPERLGNHVYGGRFGNGGYASGDGFKYRGRGPIQITFADNYRACGKKLNLALVEDPDQLLDPVIGARSAAWFYSSRGCLQSTTFDNVCDLINLGRKTDKVGDSHGYANRLLRFNEALKYA